MLSSEKIAFDEMGSGAAQILGDIQYIVSFIA